MADAKDVRRRRILDVAKSVRASRPEDPEGDEASGQFRVVITGKGGVGKTSLTALLARLLARQAYTVLALDADPQMNLPYALGFPLERARALTPLSKNAEYIEEKTGVRPGAGWGPFFRLNPDVRDVVDRFGVVGPDGVRLLVMGSLTQPATGCLCPENSLLAAVVNAISLREREVILMDTQAGVEHFGRALAKGFHQAIILTDPTFNALQVALETARLAHGLGIPAIHLAVNRVRRPSDYRKVVAFMEREGSIPFTTHQALPYDERVLEVEPSVGALLEDPGSSFAEVVSAFCDVVLRTEKEVVSCAS